MEGKDEYDQSDYYHILLPDQRFLFAGDRAQFRAITKSARDNSLRCHDDSVCIALIASQIGRMRNENEDD